MPTQLSIFNDALQIIGRQQLESPTEDKQAGRSLRDHWITVPKYCLEQADWHFARQRTQLSQTTTPTFGWDYAYQLPDANDCVRIVRLFDHAPSEDSVPLEAFVEENGQILTNADELYLIYISWTKVQDKIGAWPEYFAGYVAGELAMRSAPQLNSERLKHAIEQQSRRRKTAMAGDAASAPPKRHTPGRWSRASSTGRHRTGQSGRRPYV